MKVYSTQSMDESCKRMHSSNIVCLQNNLQLKAISVTLFFYEIQKLITVINPVEDSVLSSPYLAVFTVYQTLC